MQCYSLGSLKFASFVIFSNVFVCVLCVANSGFVLCYSLDSLELHALLCFVRFGDAFVEVVDSQMPGLRSNIILAQCDCYTLVSLFALFNYSVICSST